MVVRDKLEEITKTSSEFKEILWDISYNKQRMVLSCLVETYYSSTDDETRYTRRKKV